MSTTLEAPPKPEAVEAPEAPAVPVVPEAPPDDPNFVRTIGGRRIEREAFGGGLTWRTVESTPAYDFDHKDRFTGKVTTRRHPGKQVVTWRAGFHPGEAIQSIAS